MGKILLFAIISGTVIASVMRPWIGVLAYYTLALLFPQSIWSWIFEQIRVSLFVSAATISGFLLASFAKKLDFSILKNKQNFYLAVLWLALIQSYMFSPYGINDAWYDAVNSTKLITNINKVFLFYFVSIILIDTREKFHYLIIVLLATILYYTYWAHDMYFSGYMGIFGTYRLNGPGGIYGDENAFAMLFVMGIPFLYFMGNYYQNKIVKYLLWLTIPFAWHAIFLTSSRGGLVGTGVVSIFLAIRTKSKIFGIGILIALMIAFTWQGGDYLKEKSLTIVNYKGEGSAEGRLHAWKAGIKMMKEYPLRGVGLGNFMFAFSDFSDRQRRVAHNTIIQFAAESGILAGLMYLLICKNIFLTAWRQRKKFRGEDTDPFLLAANNSILCSLIGFFVCSLFLNLATFETFYYLLILSIVQNKLMTSEAQMNENVRSKQ